MASTSLPSNLQIHVRDLVPDMIRLLDAVYPTHSAIDAAIRRELHSEQADIFTLARGWVIAKKNFHDFRENMHSKEIESFSADLASLFSEINYGLQCAGASQVTKLMQDANPEKVSDPVIYGMRTFYQSRSWPEGAREHSLTETLGSVMAWDINPVDFGKLLGIPEEKSSEVAAIITSRPPPPQKKRKEWGGCVLP